MILDGTFIRIDSWTLLDPFGAENHPATHFFGYSSVLDELGDVLVDLVELFNDFFMLCQFLVDCVQIRQLDNFCIKCVKGV